MLRRINGGDMWDPNNWIEDDRECRIYGNDDLSIYAVVDWVHYIHLVQFRWSVHTKYVHRGRDRSQYYLRRNVSEFYDTDGERYESPITGKIVRNRRRVQYNVFLHQAVMDLAGIKPPTPDHKLIDHGDRDSLNCRLSNLSWVTHGENNNNANKRRVRNQAGVLVHANGVAGPRQPRALLADG